MKTENKINENINKNYGKQKINFGIEKRINENKKLINENI